jgi:hypothetical protein
MVDINSWVAVRIDWPARRRRFSQDVLYDICEKLSIGKTPREICRQIADDATSDWMERQRQGGTIEIVLNREHVERPRQRIDARKWLLSKALPKKYGDKQLSRRTTINPCRGAISLR